MNRYKTAEGACIDSCAAFASVFGPILDNSLTILFLMLCAAAMVSDSFSLIVVLGCTINSREKITPPGLSCTSGVGLAGLSWDFRVKC